MRRVQILGILFSTLLFAGCSAFGSKPAGVKITANIPATISFDGKENGTTPYQSTDQKAKKYTVKLSPADSTYSPHEMSLKLFSGYLTQIDWNFAKTEEESSGFSFEYESARDKNKSELQLVATPDNVPVIVDGKNVGFTPLLLDSLSEGDHTLSLSAPGYEDSSRTVRLIKGVRLLVTSKLAKKIMLPIPVPVATESAELTATASASPSAKKKATPTPTPKATPKPSATATASAKPSSSPAPSASPTASSSAGVKKTTTVKPYVQINSPELGFLRVREAPVNGKELYKLADGSTVPYANASSSGWLKVTYDGTSVGWVSGDYSKLVQ